MSTTRDDEPTVPNLRLVPPAAEDEPVNPELLVEHAKDAGRLARQSMADAVRRVERTKRRRESVRNLQAVVGSIPPPAAAEG